MLTISFLFYSQTCVVLDWPPANLIYLEDPATTIPNTDAEFLDMGSAGFTQRSAIATLDLVEYKLVFVTAMRLFLKRKSPFVCLTILVVLHTGVQELDSLYFERLTS